MRIDFEDKSSVEIIKTTSGTFLLSIKANDPFDLNKKVINSVELSREQIESILKIIN